MNAQLSLCLSFVFYVAKQKSTAVPGKETTAVPPGKETTAVSPGKTYIEK